ncbi:hypothetical protein ATO8_19334 [Roseivivax marinus]|uniref:Uncharacterized protein n=2 Tax=Roseivivax marinus TaxID=1379903 RepID=W4HFU6_9RHOB|nr:hypothetical protein ATO8_19334 [Roseivivax marinus]
MQCLTGLNPQEDGLMPVEMQIAVAALTFATAGTGLFRWMGKHVEQPDPTRGLHSRVAKLEAEVAKLRGSA